jgi:hypothetical protein
MGAETGSVAVSPRAGIMWARALASAAPQRASCAEPLRKPATTSRAGARVAAGTILTTARNRSRSPRPAMVYRKEVECADHEIGDAEGHPVGAEGARRREGNDEPGRDRGEHSQADGAFLGIEGIRQPGVR